MIDLSSVDGASQAVKSALEFLGGIDTWFNNAGVVGESCVC